MSNFESKAYSELCQISAWVGIIVVIVSDSFLLDTVAIIYSLSSLVSMVLVLWREEDCFID